MPYEYDDIKLDFEQRQRSLALGPQVVEDTDWACDAIIWQRDRIAELESELRELRSFVRAVAKIKPAYGDRTDFCDAIELAGKIMEGK